ncbi:MAG: hypothetical protein ACO1TE_26655 [Prosthecobacter sp.]
MPTSTTPSKKPATSWIISGIALLIFGLGLLPTLFMTPVGLALMLGGVAVLTAAYLRTHRDDHPR